MRKSIPITVVAALVALWLLSGGGPKPSTEQNQDNRNDGTTATVETDITPGTPAVVATPTATSSSATPAVSVPASLADTEIDGAVELDANGKLRPSLSLRRLFDQVLSSVGELSIDQIRQLLATRLDQLTTPEGKVQALAAFERYLRYLQSVDAASARLNELPFRDRLSALNELRKQLLGTEMAGAFFADEEAYQRFTLDRRELAERNDLSAEERGARERELLQQLPESSREPFVQQLQAEADFADAQAIDTQSSDAEERYSLRSERFGEEAAGRMELLDRERQAWQQRVTAYQQERARWQSSDAEAREAALAEYLARHFSEAEQRRIRSLQDVGAL